MTRSFTIAFCTTSMNRLHHLQQTLEKNIQDNYLRGEVEFILLDYNSNDGLDKWIEQNMQQHIEQGILVYYKTFEPTHYQRSHSRNMAFRLANAEILCNLDADNFLGEGFASYILNEFEKFSAEKIFVTSSCRSRDLFGRVCVKADDFDNIRGYNESLSGYGAEDLDLLDRLLRSGLKQKVFLDQRFYRVIHHSHHERIANEYRFKQIDSVYLAHEAPYKIKFLLFRKDGKCESGSLINNELCNFNHNKKFENIIDQYYDDVNRIMLDSFLLKENLQYTESETIEECGDVYFKIKDKEMLAQFIFYLSEAENFEIIRKIRNNKEIVNSNGFGKGQVYKNFDYNNTITLD